MYALPKILILEQAKFICIKLFVFSICLLTLMSSVKSINLMSTYPIIFPDLFMTTHRIFKEKTVNKGKKLLESSVSIFIFLLSRFETVACKRFNTRGASRSRLIARTRRFDFDRILFAICSNYIA